LNNPDKASGTDASQIGNLSGTEIAQRSTRGGLLIFAGNLLSTVMMAISSIVIARLLGPESFGSYALVSLIPSMLQLFYGFGVGHAMVRHSAYLISKGQADEARRYSINAMIFLLLSAVAFAIFCYAGSGFIAAVVLHRGGLAPLVRYISIAVLAQAVFQASINGLVGWNSMGLAGLSTVLQAAVRVSVAPALVLAGFGVFGALTGYTAGYSFAGVVGVVGFYVYRLRRAAGGTYGGRRLFYGNLKEMLSYGLPIYIGNMLTGLSNFYVTVLVAAIASDAVVGYYQAALNVTVAATLATAAITVALFPAFSSLHGLGADTAAAFRYASKYVTYLIAPVILFLVAGSDLIMRTFYGAAFSSAGAYLAILALADVPPVLGMLVATVFFNAVGKTRLSLAVNGLGAVVVFVLSPIMGIALGEGVSGLIYATIVAGVLSATAGLYFASRYLQATVDLRGIAGILGASVLAWLATLPLSLVRLPAPVALLASLLVFLLVYLTAAPLLKAVNSTDVATLGVALRGMGAFAKLLRPVLGYELLIIRRLKGRAEGEAEQNSQPSKEGQK
jgi:O-antigen/teichoic acid export membrane protein